MRYHEQQHRSQPHSRQADWFANLPGEGLRARCTWEQFCRFAREPERRKGGVDARVTVAGTAYEVDPQLAGEVGLRWWGLFDDALYVEYEGERFGPYAPVSGPIPLQRYRAVKRGKREERADRIRQLADQLTLPMAALAGNALQVQPSTTPPTLLTHPFEADALE
jgi:putative transposase